MQFITANLSGKTRREYLHGREYLVAPLSMIVPGVLNGSKGAMYYPPEELARDPMAWNGMPMVVNHPMRDGSPISARDPEVLQNSGIGFVYRTKHDGVLGAEGWFDVQNTRRVDRRILARLEGGNPIEISTGLYTDNYPAPPGATHNGRAYSLIARNYRPDHLAILPDKVGACSVADGCGVLVNDADGVAAVLMTSNDWKKWNDEHKGQGGSGSTAPSPEQVNRSRIAQGASREANRRSSEQSVYTRQYHGDRWKKQADAHHAKYGGETGKPSEHHSMLQDDEGRAGHASIAQSHREAETAHRDAAKHTIGSKQAKHLQSADKHARKAEHHEYGAQRGKPKSWLARLTGNDWKKWNDEHKGEGGGDSDMQDRYGGDEDALAPDTPAEAMHRRLVDGAIAASHTAQSSGSAEDHKKAALAHMQAAMSHHQRGDDHIAARHFHTAEMHHAAAALGPGARLNPHHLIDNFNPNHDTETGEFSIGGAAKKALSAGASTAAKLGGGYAAGYGGAKAGGVVGTQGGRFAGGAIGGAIGRKLGQAPGGIVGKSIGGAIGGFVGDIYGALKGGAVGTIAAEHYGGAISGTAAQVGRVSQGLHAGSRVVSKTISKVAPVLDKAKKISDKVSGYTGLGKGFTGNFNPNHDAHGEFSSGSGGSSSVSKARKTAGVAVGLGAGYAVARASSKYIVKPGIEAGAKLGMKAGGIIGSALGGLITRSYSGVETGKAIGQVGGAIVGGIGTGFAAGRGQQYAIAKGVAPIASKVAGDKKLGEVATAVGGLAGTWHSVIKDYRPGSSDSGGFDNDGGTQLGPPGSPGGKGLQIPKERFKGRSFSDALSGGIGGKNSTSTSPYKLPKTDPSYEPGHIIKNSEAEDADSE